MIINSADTKRTRCKSHYGLSPNSWTKQRWRLRVTTWCRNRNTNFWVIPSITRFREVYSFKYKVFIDTSILFLRGNRETHFFGNYWLKIKKKIVPLQRKLKELSKDICHLTLVKDLRFLIIFLEFMTMTWYPRKQNWRVSAIFKQINHSIL